MKITLFLPQKETKTTEAEISISRRWFKSNGFEWTERVVSKNAVPRVELTGEGSRLSIPYGDPKKLDVSVSLFAMEEIRARSNGFALNRKRTTTNLDSWFS